MQKEKLVIFTLSRQQKITPNCKWGGGLWAGEGEGAAAERLGRPASRQIFFFSSLHVWVKTTRNCLTRDLSCLGSGENVDVVDI